MKLVHTSYILTTILFVVLAALLLVREPQIKKDSIQTQEEKQPVQLEKKTVEQQQSKQVDPMDLLGHLPKVEVTATGYYAGVESTGKGESHPQYGITYSGVKAKRDIYSTIAADLNVFPLGTILYIPGYGYGVVADIGSAIKGHKIDLYFNTLQDVYKKWGKKTLDVYVVQKGKGIVTEAMMKELNSKQLVQANSVIN